MGIRIYDYECVRCKKIVKDVAVSYDERDSQTCSDCKSVMNRLACATSHYTPIANNGASTRPRSK